MKIIQQHFNTIDSTQKCLIEYLKNNPNLSHENNLVSANNQTIGRGRGEHIWEHQSGGICLSFNIKPLEIITLTSLEMAVLCCHFFKKGMQVKWPNDLMNNQSKKIGGILINFINNQLIVGIGINYSHSQNDHYPSLTTEQKLNQQNLSYDLFQYILNNRIPVHHVQDEWNKLCCHLNQNVFLLEGEDKFHGKFIGLGKNGEAVLQDKDSKINEFINGSLVV